jgi:ABC-type transport system substrate-binding protein
VDFDALIQKTLDAQPQGVTPADMASAVQQAMASQPGVTQADVADAIAQAMAGQQDVTPADVASAVQSAMASQPGVTQAEVADAIGKALAAQPGVTEAQMADAIAGAMVGMSGVTEGQVADAIASALRNQAPGLTEGDVADAISKALMDMPGMSQADIEAAVESAMANAAALEAMAMEKSEEAKMMAEKEAAVSLPEPQAAVGTIKIAGESLPPAVGLNRHGASDAFNFMGIGEALFMPTEEGNIQGPMLAKSFTIAPDLSAATVTIQDGVMFHKGFGEMTAADVAWSLNDANAAVTPESIHGQAGDFRVLFKEASAIDESTFNLPFENFDPAWDGNRTNMFGFSFGVISKGAYDENGEDWSRENVIMTGPFEIDSWVTDDHGFLNAVPDHWRQPPMVNRLHLISLPEPATRLASLLTGEIDVAKPDFKDLKRLVDAGFKTASAGGGRKAGIFWGGNYWETHDPRTGEALPPIGLTYDPNVPWAVVVPVADPMTVDERMEKARMVRWAMSLAIDRSLVNETLMDGLAWPEYMWSASVIQPEWQDRWLIPYDTSRAEQLLDEAGYPRGSDGVRFNVDIFRSGVNVGAISDAVAGFWDEVGIRTTVDKSSYATVRPSLVARSFVKINIQAIGETATNRPFDWPKGGEMTSLGRGGFGPGVEVAEITQSIIDTGAEPDRLKRVEINTALIDYMHHMMQGSAVVSLPDLIMFNSKAIESWPMRQASSLDMMAFPEFIVPAR